MSSSDFYNTLLQEARGLLSGGRNYIANTANISSLIYNELNKQIKSNQVNWVGFYLVDKSKSDPELVLGPFMGEPACIRIKFGRGVCGTSISEKRTILVEDVHHFPGHIACDSRSNSELVIPLFHKDTQEAIGVLDLDSLVVGGFNEEDKIALETLVKDIIDGCDWP